PAQQQGERALVSRALRGAPAVVRAAARARAGLRAGALLPRSRAQEPRARPRSGRVLRPPPRPASLAPARRRLPAARGGGDLRLVAPGAARRHAGGARRRPGGGVALRAARLLRRPRAAAALRTQLSRPCLPAGAGSRVARRALAQRQ